MIRFEGLSFAYEGQRPLLENVSLTWRDGAVTGLVGPNGAGKSTCLKLASGLIKPRAGRILINGASQPQGRALSQLCAYLPQGRTAPAISVRSLVSHGRFPYTGLGRKLSPRDHEAIDRALEVTGLSDWAEREVRTLSGGQQQKVYLALLIAQDAPHLLLDEPTAYLDVRHQLELCALLRRFAEQGKAVTVVLHDLSQAMEICDEIQLLSQGQLLYAGPPAGLIQSGAIQRSFAVEPLIKEGLHFSLPT